MRLVVQIQRKIFGVLRLDDLDVFGEDLVIEVESLLDRCIFVEVAAERDKEPCSTGGNGRGRIQDMQLHVARKCCGELGRKGQEDFKPPMPLKVGRRTVLVAVGIVADCADDPGGGRRLSQNSDLVLSLLYRISTL